MVTRLNRLNPLIERCFSHHKSSEGGGFILVQAQLSHFENGIPDLLYGAIGLSHGKEICYFIKQLALEIIQVNFFGLFTQMPNLNHLGYYRAPFLHDGFIMSVFFSLDF